MWIKCNLKLYEYINKIIIKMSDKSSQALTVFVTVQFVNISALFADYLLIDYLYLNLKINIDDYLLYRMM